LLLPVLWKVPRVHLPPVLLLVLLLLLLLARLLPHS
jgi:hypothetical protein